MRTPPFKQTKFPMPRQPREMNIHTGGYLESDTLREQACIETRLMQGYSHKNCLTQMNVQLVSGLLPADDQPVHRNAEKAPSW